MSTKRIFPCALVLAVLGWGVVRAQELPREPLPQEPPPAMAGPPGPAGAASNGPAPAGPSNWLTYSRPECCGPLGGNGPIHEELFVRSGFSFPLGQKVFGHVLEIGWEIEGGGRSLFFNPEMDRAWALDLSLANIHNTGQHSDHLVPLNFTPATGPATTVNLSVRDLNRTQVSLGAGREWYLRGNASTCGEGRWRIGLDGGGRLGSSKLNFNSNTSPIIIPHKTDVLSALYVALHTDWEFPLGGCCTFLAGLRLEWDYTWMDILQHQNDSDVQDLNLLFTFGVRF